MAAACLHLLEVYDGPVHVNVGSGEDVTIKELADTVAEAVGYQGRVEWDTSKPDGMPRKLLDVTTLIRSGWQPRIGLARGIVETVAWYRAHQDSRRT